MICRIAGQRIRRLSRQVLEWILVDQSGCNRCLKELFCLPSASANRTVGQRIAILVPAVALSREPDSPLLGIALGDRFQLTIGAEVFHEVLLGFLVGVECARFHFRSTGNVLLEERTSCNALNTRLGESKFRQPITNLAIESANPARRARVHGIAGDFCCEQRLNSPADFKATAEARRLKTPPFDEALAVSVIRLGSRIVQPF